MPICEEFIGNRPFFYAIVNKDTGNGDSSILFSGQLANPIR